MFIVVAGWDGGIYILYISGKKFWFIVTANNSQSVFPSTWVEIWKKNKKNISGIMGKSIWCDSSRNARGRGHVLEFYSRFIQRPNETHRFLELKYEFVWVGTLLKTFFGGDNVGTQRHNVCFRHFISLNSHWEREETWRESCFAHFYIVFQRLCFEFFYLRHRHCTLVMCSRPNIHITAVGGNTIICILLLIFWKLNKT